MPKTTRAFLMIGSLLILIFNLGGGLVWAQTATNSNTVNQKGEVNSKILVELQPTSLTPAVAIEGIMIKTENGETIKVNQKGETKSNLPAEQDNLVKPVEENKIKPSASSTGTNYSADGTVISNSAPTYATPVAINVCAVDEGLMREFKDLILRLEELEKSGNQEEYQAIQEKVKFLKEEINRQKEKCEKNITSAQSAASGGGVAPVKVPSEVSTENQNIANDACLQQKNLQEKLNYYKKLTSLSAEEAKEKGYQSKSEIGKIVADLNYELAKMKQDCLKPDKKITSIIKPVAPSNGNEITDYFKEKAAQVFSENTTSDQKVKKLQDLKTDIDGMIKELIRGQENINYQNIKPLVNSVIVETGKINADGTMVEVNSKKSLSIEMKNQKMDLNVDNKKVEMNQDGVKAEISGSIKVEENKISLDNNEFKTTLQEVVKKTSVSDNASIKLETENNKPVYKVKETAQKKILGLFPVEVRKEFSVDANTAKIIKKDKPWWSFLAF